MKYSAQIVIRDVGGQLFEGHRDLHFGSLHQRLIEIAEGVSHFLSSTHLAR